MRSKTSFDICWSIPGVLVYLQVMKSRLFITAFGLVILTQGEVQSLVKQGQKKKTGLLWSTSSLSLSATPLFLGARRLARLAQLQRERGSDGDNEERRSSTGAKRLGGPRGCGSTPTLQEGGGCTPKDGQREGHQTFVFMLSDKVLQHVPLEKPPTYVDLH